MDVLSWERKKNSHRDKNIAGVIDIKKEYKIFQFRISLVTVEMIILTTLIFLFLYRGLQLGKMWSFSDLLPFNTQRNIDSFFGTWDSNLLGYPFIASSVVVIPIFLGKIIGNDIIAQNVYYISLIPLSFVTMYLLSRKFIPSYIGRYSASLLYALNPITIGEFFNGSAWMNIYVLAPVIILFIVQFLEEERIYILYGLTISILIGLIYSNLWIIVWSILFPLSSIILVKLIKELRNKNYHCLIRITILFVFISLGLLLLLPSIHYIFFAKETAFRPDSTQSYFNDIKHNYQLATPANILRMAGNAGSPMDFLGYNEYNWWTILGFVIPIFIIRAADRQLAKDVYLISFLAIILITVIFMFLTNLKLTYWLYEKIPFMFSIRNPKYLMYSFSLAASVLFGLGIHKYIDHFKDYKKYIAFCTILLFLIIYLHPIWNGDMGLNARYEYTVPEYYYSTFDYIKKDDEYHRVLWLPYTYAMQARLVNSIDHVGIKFGQDVLSSPSYDNIHNLFLSIEHDRKENFAQNLGFYNVKYVIIDKNFTSDKQKEFGFGYSDDINTYNSYNTPFIRGSPENFKKYIESIYGLENIYEDGNVVIYKNDFFIPYLFILNISNANIPGTKEKSIIKSVNFSNQTDYWKIWNVEGGNISILNTYVNITNPNNNSVVATQGFNATAGNKYTFSLVMNTNSNYSHAKIVWYDQLINTSEKMAVRHDVVYKIVDEDGWKKYKETFTAPKNTVFGMVYLVAGKTTMDIPAYSNFSDVSIIETDPDTLISDFNKSDVSYIKSFKSINEKISFNVKTNGNSTLVLLESYNTDWNAYIDNKPLKHFKVLNWANGFQIPEKENASIIRIEYAPQKNRDIIISIWAFTWMLVAICLIFLINKKLKRY